MVANLDKLELIHDLRSIWPNEEYNFTPWLAQKDNIQILSDVVGIPIKVIKTEASVGKYELDILAVNESTGENIIIENQLEYTDHDHLGKLLVYGAGYDARTIIWIVKDVTDEHKQAVEWLNEHSTEDINIFLIKIELFKIGKSLPAPHFDIVCMPNDWSKVIRNTQSVELTERNIKYMSFWQGFIDYCKEHNSSFSYRKTSYRSYYELSMGISGVQVDLSFDRDGSLTCGIWIRNNKELFEMFKNHKVDIEEELGELIWDSKEENYASSIRKVYKKRVDIQSNNEEVYEWLLTNAEMFKEIFKRIERGNYNG